MSKKQSHENMSEEKQILARENQKPESESKSYYDSFVDFLSKRGFVEGAALPTGD